MRALMSAKLKWTGSAATAVILIATFAWMMAGCAGITRLPNSTTVSALSISTTSLPSGTVGQAYSATLAASGGNAPYTWSVSSGSLPSGVNLTAAGAVTGMPSSAGTFAFTATASDAKNATAAKSLSILVGAASQPLSITTSSLPAGTVGQTYTATLTASGGNAPYTWSVSGGGLPPGLSLASASGAITGTPNSAGTFAFTATATDSKGATAAGSLHILVATTGQPLSITTTNLPSGTSGTAYTATVQASGGKTPYGWSIASGALPAGINLNASSGAISGTPTQSGSFSVTIRAQDSSSPVQTTSKIFAVAIAAAVIPLSISTSTLPSVGVNQAYSANLQAAGGTPPYTWSLNSGQLPAGIALASNGQISGAPTTSGQSNFGVTAKDSSSTPETASRSLAITVSAAGLDQYGGRTDIDCSTTGKWSTQEINNQWWICTPAAHGMFLEDVENITSMSAVSDSVMKAKYGSTSATGPAWSEATLKRMQAWGFNTLGVYAVNELFPVTTDSSFPLDSNGYHSHTIKLPFWTYSRPSFYSMRNPTIHTWADTNVQFLSDPVKNIFGAVSPVFNDYIPPGGVGDYFDAKMQTWMDDDIAQDWGYGYIKNNPYNDYLIGFVADDSDEMYGLANGPDFPTIPAGHNDALIALVILSDSPVQTANSGLGFVYADTEMHSKFKLHDLLVSEYGTIAALNTAWGSSYTTFDSSGTCVGTQPVTCASDVSADSVGTGDGSSLTFSTTLSHTTVSGYSLQILVAGTPVAGDLGNGSLYGPNISSGTINYSTGALSITFASGKAPATGTAITAGYVANGWGIGTGLMDEDMRTSHQAWLGNSWDSISSISGGTLSPMDATTSVDLNAFLKQMAGWYFQMFANGVHGQFPNVLVMLGLGGWNGVPPAPVLQAAGQYVDLIEEDQTSGAFSQTKLDFIAANYGNKPFIANAYLTATPDSEYGNSGTNSAVGDGGFSTQNAKGQGYASVVSGLLGARNSSGVNPNAGIILWDWMDNAQTNWGLVSEHDNAYDGHEDVTGSVPCSAPISEYTCGGEPGNYGNAIGSISAANQLWLTH